MSKKQFVSFKAVKAALTMEQVLEHYNLLPQFKRSGDSLSGPCPIHKGNNPTQFRISISKNIWNCFSECKHGGNTLDFIARMENISIHAAALKAIEWFKLDPDPAATDDDEEAKTEPVQEKRFIVPVQNQEQSTPNKPLQFRLEKLVRQHPYLEQRGLTQETIINFGIGYCEKGMMKERIAIPIHNEEGSVVAYAGRCVGEPEEGKPKYKLPPGFKKSQELFNLDRAIKEPDRKPLVIVEGFFDCMKLHQWGCKKVVALMGCTLSPIQESLIRKHSKSDSHVIVMLDEDEAGRAGREDIVVRLSRFVFVRMHSFRQEGFQPEHLDAQEVQALCA